MARHRYFDSVNVVDGELNVLCHHDPRRRPIVFVLLHDADESAMSWQLVLDRLPANVAALAPDLRGRAMSNTLAPPTTIEQHVDDLTRLLDHFGVDQAGLLGIGSGSVLAEHLGELLVERVAVTLGVERSLDAATLEEGAQDRVVVDGAVLEKTAVSAGDFERSLVRERLLSGEPSRHTRRIIVGPSIDALTARELNSTDATFLRAGSCHSLLATAAGADAIADLVRVVIGASSNR